MDLSRPDLHPGIPQRGILHPIPEVSLSWPVLLLSGNGHGADALSPLAKSPTGESEHECARQLRKSRGEGGKVLFIPPSEAQKSPRTGHRLEPLDGSGSSCFCSPGRAWLEAHSGGLWKLDCRCPQLTPTRRILPPSLPPGAEQRARSKC